MFPPDPALFDPNSVPDDTKELNQWLIQTAEAAPDMWQFSADAVRQARREGKSVFPLETPDKDAEVISVPGQEEPVELRIIRPAGGGSRGTFLHIHGGGWMLGASDLQDARLKALANDTGLICASVEYRLAPENPYPAACDDCEAAALWLAQNARSKFGSDFLAVGGESAGAHLAANALLRLREKHGLLPFSASVFIAGAFDMSGTPSTRNFHEKLVLTTRDIEHFANGFLQNNEDRKDPDISPIFANLEGMPPAHFSVGTRDALLDDSIFMANRWIQSQGDTELDIYPGACHVFQYFPDLAQSKESRKRIGIFLNRLIG